jgi:hypothetical protein
MTTASNMQTEPVLAPQPQDEPRTDNSAVLRCEQRQDGQLWAQRGEETRAVVVVRCFPWSEPRRFISLRDTEDDEFALVEDPSELEAASREALEQSLATAGFVLEIERILSCEEEVEIRTWEVLTCQGRRRFQTRRDDWPREIPGGGLLIRDVAGDLFQVREPEKLDKKSQAVLWVFVDD